MKTNVKVALCTPDALCSSPSQFLNQLTNSYEICASVMLLEVAPTSNFSVSHNHSSKTTSGDRREIVRWERHRVFGLVMKHGNKLSDNTRFLTLSYVRSAQIYLCFDTQPVTYISIDYLYFTHAFRSYKEPVSECYHKYMYRISDTQSQFPSDYSRLHVWLCNLYPALRTRFSISH